MSLIEYDFDVVTGIISTKPPDCFTINSWSNCLFKSSILSLNVIYNASKAIADSALTVITVSRLLIICNPGVSSIMFSSPAVVSSLNNNS